MLNKRVQGTGARVIETRKTVPGLRVLDKWGVLAGGGANHRIGLFDMVMIKDNHVTAAGGITAALTRTKVPLPAWYQGGWMPAAAQLCYRSCGQTLFAPVRPVELMCGHDVLACVSDLKLQHSGLAADAGQGLGKHFTGRRRAGRQALPIAVVLQYVWALCTVQHRLTMSVQYPEGSPQTSDQACAAESGQTWAMAVLLASQPASSQGMLPACADLAAAEMRPRQW